MSKQQNLWIKPRIEPAIMKQLTSRNNIKGMMQLLTQVLLIVIIGMLAYKSFYDTHYMSVYHCSTYMVTSIVSLLLAQLSRIVT